MFIYFNRSNRGTKLLQTHSSLIHHLNNVIFWALSASHFLNLQRSEPKITRITTLRICNLIYQAESRWDPKCVFNFLRFFLRILYKSNYIIFILSWCGTYRKIRSKLVDIVEAGSQKITLWGPQRTPPFILRVKVDHSPDVPERNERSCDCWLGKV